MRGLGLGGGLLDSLCLFLGQIARLERLKQAQMTLHVALDDGDEAESGLLRVVQTLLLGVDLLVELRQLDVRGVDLRIGLRVHLCVLQHGGALGLRFLNHLRALRLCVGHGGGLLRLLRAVFLQLFDQDLHLGLEHGVFLVERNIVFRQRFEKIIDLLHIIAAEDGLRKGLLLNFLRCKHGSDLPVQSEWIKDRRRYSPARRSDHRQYPRYTA